MKRKSVIFLLALELYATSTMVIKKETPYDQQKLNEIYTKYYEKNYNIKIDLNQKKSTTLKSDLYNEFEINFIFVKTGSFMMGSLDNANSQPVHEVKINYNFYMSKYEVTNKEYLKFLNANMKNFKDSWIEIQSGWSRSNIKKDTKYYVDKEFENQPVVYVSWEGAKAYTKWLSDISGSSFRLPTESEWEYVARGNTKTNFFFGDDENLLDSYSWSYTNSGASLHDVGLLKANNLGLHDMSGNAWEWCEDTYSGTYKNAKSDGSANLQGYVKVAKTAASTNSWLKSGSNSEVKELETIVTDDKVMRGVSFLNFSSSHMTHYREDDNYQSKSKNVGFRIVKIVKEEK